MTLSIQQKEKTKNFSFKKQKSTSMITKDTVLTVKINALSASNMGLAELPNGFTLMIPKVNFGDELVVQVEKVFSGKAKYATAKVLKVVKQSETNNELSKKVGQVLDVTISKTGPKGSGLARLPENFILIIPGAQHLAPVGPGAKVGDQVRVRITRIKQNYGFAQIVDNNTDTLADTQQSVSKQKITNNKFSVNKEDLQIGAKLHIILPEKSKYFANYAIIKIKDKIVFVKMQLGAELGKQVKIQIIKLMNDFAIAKVIKLSPLSKTQKQLLVKKSIQKMVETGLHFGEKAIRCHANMRKFIWVKKKGKYQNRPFLRKGRHIINVLKTRQCLNKALKQLAKYAAKGKTFLFVGTKKSAAALIARTATLSQTSFFVNTRWLGGMLTNWKTILKSISQIRPILKEKQRIIKTILEKRQRIKIRLIHKVNLLRNKTSKLMLKGKHLITKIQQNKTEFFTKSQKLLSKKNEILHKNQCLVKKYSDLNLKQQTLIQQSRLLEEAANQLILQKQNLIKELVKCQNKLQNFKQLFLVGQELLKFKKSAEQEGKVLLTMPYAKLTKLAKQNQNTSWLVPNPSKEILNQIIATLKISDGNELNIDVVSSNSNFTKSVANQTNIIVFSKILDKFITMLPLVQFSFNKLIKRIDNIQLIIKSININLEKIQTKVITIQELNNQIKNQLKTIELKFNSQQQLLKSLRIQLKRLASEQRLLKFLPRLRYLPTPKNKMIETVDILMKKFVDPKMTYPVDQIYDQKLKFTSKKIAAMRKQKWQRLEKYFGGVTKMAKMQKKQISQNVAIIVGQQEEMNAVLECQKLGIKMFTIIDTNCNPRLSDHIIPANDDSRNSIKFILGEMLTYMRLAQKLRKKIISKRIKQSYV